MRFNHSRRLFLRSAAGVCLALPTLESLLPRAARAQGADKRLMVIYHPNGTPQRTGDATIPAELLSKLSAYSNRMSVVRNMGNLKFYGESRNAFASAHLCNYFPIYRGQGVQPGHESVTFDQILAAKPGFADAPLPTLSYTMDATSVGAHGGNPNHYNSLSWKGPNAPVLPYTSPRALFAKLVSLGGQDVAAQPVNDASERLRLRNKRNVLNAVLDQVRAIEAKAGSEDRKRLDEYLTGIEELDRKTEALMSNEMAQTMASEFTCSAEGSVSDPSRYPERLALVQDIMVRAFQCGLTRVGTLSLGPPAGANFPSVAYVPGLSVGSYWHPLSHWASDHNISGASSGAVYEDFKKVVAWHYEKTARFVEKLDSIHEGDGTLLDNTLVCLGSSMAYGAHNSDHIYQCLIGGRGLIRHGQDIDARLVTTGNLWSTIVGAFTGTPVKVGKSTGTIAGLV